MKKILKLTLMLACFGISTLAIASNNIQALKMMFNEMVLGKNISVMSKYYDPRFKLYSNGKTMGYQEFYQGHAKVYKTPIQYSVKFDNDTVIQQGNKVAARLFITTKLPKQKPTKIEVILIAQYHNDKIYRLWELTYPNWSKLKSFKVFSK